MNKALRISRGDLDGFFALGLDNFIMLLLMNGLCLGVIGFDAELFYTRILPANAVGLIIGNLYYARMARQLASKEQRNDVCALPYGINLLTVLVFTFGVMLPAKLVALSDGATEQEAIRIAWHAGLAACLVSGFVELLGAFVAGWVKKVTPRAALLSAIGAIGLFFIAADYFFRAYQYPLIGIPTIVLMSAAYFGKRTFAGGIPTGFVILVVGTSIAWLQYMLTGEGVVPYGNFETRYLGLHLPLPVLGDLIEALRYLPAYLPIVLSMGFVSLTGSLMNIESAEAAGDKYPVKPALLFNGIGSIATAIFGSPFPTTIYIGHPGWKALGAGYSYSTLNAIVFTAILLTGTISAVAYIIPVEAGMAILVWLGVMMVAQSSQAVPHNHIPAVAFGLMPALGAFAILTVQRVWSSFGYGVGQALPENIADILVGQGLYIGGVATLNAGYLYICMILTAALVEIIEKRFYRAGHWMVVAALLSAVGFIHSYSLGGAGYQELMAPSWDWVGYYLLAAALLYIFPFVTKPREEKA